MTFFGCDTDVSPAVTPARHAVSARAARRNFLGRSCFLAKIFDLGVKLIVKLSYARATRALTHGSPCTSSCHTATRTLPTMAAAFPCRLSGLGAARAAERRLGDASANAVRDLGRAPRRRLARAAQGRLWDVRACAARHLGRGRRRRRRGLRLRRGRHRGDCGEDVGERAGDGDHGERAGDGDLALAMSDGVMGTSSESESEESDSVRRGEEQRDDGEAGPATCSSPPPSPSAAATSSSSPSGLSWMARPLPM